MSHLRRLYSHFQNDNLFRNSIYLMMSTLVMAVFGFVFWLISARIFTPAQIGVATGLISAMSLISYVSLLGFNNTFIRILPNAKNRNNIINTGLLLSISVAVIVATGYILIIPHIVPQLAIVRKNFWYSFAFIVMVALAAINLLTDSIFIAYRQAKYNLLIDGGIQGGIKMFSPFIFVAFGAYGVFASAGIASAAGMIASIIFLIVKFNYKPELKIHKQTFRDVFKYSFANYIANILNIAPTLVLPLVVIDKLGSANAGYYYLAFMVANLLYAVAYSMSQSLFAEGSYGENALEDLVKRSTIVILLIMIPAGILLALLGPFILHFFGKSYGIAASNVIVAFALASPAVAAYSIGNTLLRLTKQVYPVIVVNAIYFLTISALAIVWVHRGLVWVAVAWMIGNTAAAVAAFIAISYSKRKNSFS
jgi:O-antigen/teichoic acid export membrane protein